MTGLQYLKYTYNLSDRELVYAMTRKSLLAVGKGKDHVRYEYGQKAGVVKTNCRNWVLNVEDLTGSPCDAHTLVRV